VLLSYLWCWILILVHLYLRYLLLTLLSGAEGDWSIVSTVSLLCRLPCRRDPLLQWQHSQHPHPHHRHSKERVATTALLTTVSRLLGLCRWCSTKLVYNTTHECNEPKKSMQQSQVMQLPKCKDEKRSLHQYASCVLALRPLPALRWVCCVCCVEWKLLAGHMPAWCCPTYCAAVRLELSDPWPLNFLC